MVLLSGANLNIKNLFFYNLGAELYIINNINYLYNYKEVKPITINIKDNSLTIFRYREARIILKYNKRKKLLILKKITYCLNFYTNIIYNNALFNIGIKIN